MPGSASAADWLEAVGTVGAFAVALILAFSQFRSNQRTARRAQAILMTAWLDVAELDGTKHMRLVTKNNSLSQVNDFKGIITDNLQPQAQPTIVRYPGVAPAGIETYNYLDVPLPRSRQDYRYELTYEFTDVQNRRWRHKRGEGLIEIALDPDDRLRPSVPTDPTAPPNAALP